MGDVLITFQVVMKILMIILFKWLTIACLSRGGCRKFLVN